jgi:hypothetical protein
MPITLWLRFGTCLLSGNGAFVNETAVTDVQLNYAWLQAQEQIATQPFPLSFAGGPMHAPDIKARTVTPENVTVIAVPDEPISNLVKVNPKWGTHTDPSGAILEQVGFSYVTVHAITCTWTRPRVYAAASELPAVLVYEFENIILKKLGYDVSGR